jgi:hypothetical protein
MKESSMKKLTLWYTAPGEKAIKIAKGKTVGELKGKAREDAAKHIRLLNNYTWTNPVKHYLVFLGIPTP